MQNRTESLITVSFKVSKFSILSFLLIFTNCKSQSDQMTFSLLSQENKIKTLSENVNGVFIDDFFNDDQQLDFWKLIIQQTNGDNLIVEQKDDEGYLVLLKIGYEQFVIVQQPQTTDELNEILKKYLLQKDRLMQKVKFH